MDHTSFIADTLGRSPALVLKDGSLNYVSGQVWEANGHPTILIRIHYLGICRSDAKEVTMERKGLSHFGHEIMGEVVFAPHGLGIAIGDFVGIDPNIPVQRSSGYCGYFAMSADHIALRKAVYKLPLSRPDPDFIFVEPLACSHHAVTRASEVLGELQGKDVLVIGAGVAGILIALSCVESGSRTPKIANRGHERARWARDIGLGAYFDIVSIEECAGKFDAVFIATSFVFDDLIDLAGDCVTPNGALVLYGGTHPGQCYAQSVDIDALRRTEGVRPHHFANGISAFLVGTYGIECQNYRASIDLVHRSSHAKQIARKLTQEILPPSLAAQHLTLMSYTPLPGKAVIDMTPWLDATRIEGVMV